MITNIKYLVRFCRLASVAVQAPFLHNNEVRAKKEQVQQLCGSQVISVMVTVSYIHLELLVHRKTSEVTHGGQT
jgi:hypothetical protein